MLWIHGGAYVIGTGTFPGLEPYGMVALGEVIVVAINYRLGPLGFITTGRWSLLHPVLPAPRLNRGIELFLTLALCKKKWVPRFADPITVNVISMG